MPTSSYRVVEVGEDAAEKLVSESGSYMDARRSYMDASFAKFRAGEVKGCVKLIEGAEKVMEEQDHAAWLSHKRKGKDSGKGNKRQKKQTKKKDATAAAKVAAGSTKKPARVSLGGDEGPEVAPAASAEPTTWQKLAAQDAAKVNANPFWSDLSKKEMQGWSPSQHAVMSKPSPSSSQASPLVQSTLVLPSMPSLALELASPAKPKGAEAGDEAAAAMPAPKTSPLKKRRVSTGKAADAAPAVAPSPRRDAGEPGAGSSVTTPSKSADMDVELSGSAKKAKLSKVSPTEAEGGSKTAGGATAPSAVPVSPPEEETATAKKIASVGATSAKMSSLLARVKAKGQKAAAAKAAAPAPAPAPALSSPVASQPPSASTPASPASSPAPRRLPTPPARFRFNDSSDVSFSPSSSAGAPPEVIVCRGDITVWQPKEGAGSGKSAVVNAANERMLGGGGVDGAIHRAAGVGLRGACERVKCVSPGVRCPTGEARITDAFRLPVDKVIHTVGPIYKRKRAELSAKLLRSAYATSLELAAANGVTDVAFPAISCGVFDYPIEEAAAIALAAIKDHARTMPNSKVRVVSFVLFDAKTTKAWLNAALDVAEVVV